VTENEKLFYLARLDTAAESFGLSKNDQAWAKLLDYLALLQKWNKTYNLTAIRDVDEMFIKHILDSLSVAPHIESKRLIDVGTGGGLPGIPLAILFPERQIDLLDSNSKKTRFLVQAKAELGLQNVEVIHHRVEAYHPETLYDGVVSRAFASLDDILRVGILSFLTTSFEQKSLVFVGLLNILYKYYPLIFHLTIHYYQNSVVVLNASNGITGSAW